VCVRMRVVAGSCKERFADVVLHRAIVFEKMSECDWEHELGKANTTTSTFCVTVCVCGMSGGRVGGGVVCCASVVQFFPCHTVKHEREWSRPKIAQHTFKLFQR
jgi:hypothetical protein